MTPTDREALNTDEYRKAVSSSRNEVTVFTVAYDWHDKPHRLVFDLCNEIDRLRAECGADTARVDAEREIRVGQEDDEIVAHGHIHVERMSDSHIWANLGGVSFDFVAKRGKLLWSVQLSDGWQGIERSLREASCDA